MPSVGVRNYGNDKEVPATCRTWSDIEKEAPVLKQLRSIAMTGFKPWKLPPNFPDVTRDYGPPALRFCH